MTKIAWAAYFRIVRTWLRKWQVLTDPIWWSICSGCRSFLNSNYRPGLSHIGLPLVIHLCGSGCRLYRGGWLSSSMIKRGCQSTERVKRYALCALAVCQSSSQLKLRTCGWPWVWFRWQLLLIKIGAQTFSRWFRICFAACRRLRVGIGGFAGAVAGCSFPPRSD